MSIRPELLSDKELIEEALRNGTYTEKRLAKIASDQDEFYERYYREKYQLLSAQEDRKQEK